MSKKVTYEQLIATNPSNYIVEQLTDHELMSFHQIMKSKSEDEQTNLERKAIHSYLPMVESTILKRQDVIKKAKEQEDELSKKKKEDDEEKETKEFQDLEDDGVVSDNDEDNVEKGGEGSRGGRVIGRTKSGKPIYEKHEQEHTQHYTHEDHSDAMSAHMLEAKDHSQHATFHNSFDNDKRAEASEKERHKKLADEHKSKQNHHSSMAALHEGAMNQKLDKKIEENETKRRPPLTKEQIVERTKRKDSHSEDDDRENDGERDDYDDYKEIQDKKLKGDDN